MTTQKGSPSWVTDKITHFNNELVDFVVRNNSSTLGSLILCFFLCGILVYLSLIFPPETYGNFLNQWRIWIGPTDRFHLVSIILIFGFFSHALSLDKAKTALACLIFIYVGHIWRVEVSHPLSWSLAFFYFQIGLPLCAATLILLKVPPVRAITFFLFLIAGGVLLRSQFSSEYSDGRIYAVPFLWFPLRIMMPMILLISERYSTLTLVPLKSWSFWAQLFFPANFFSAVPSLTSSEFLKLSRQPHRSSVLLKGLRDLYLAVLLQVVSMWLGQKMSKVLPWEGFSYHFFHGYILYFSTYLNAMIALLTVIGCCRILGFDMFDPFHVPLLAANPFERWKRWNTYYYEWLKTLVFFPLFKWKKNLFIAVIVTFLVSYLIHVELVLVELIQRPLDYWLHGRVLTGVCHHLLQAILVYFYLKAPGLWPSDSTLKGWWGVLGMHLLMGLIFIFPPY